MSIDYKNEQILEYEKQFNIQYIGYFAPNGELIDFKGNNHTDYHNKLVKDFLSYTSYIIDGKINRGYRKEN